MSFQQLSYQLHENQYNIKGNSLERLSDKESIDFWRHNRMYSILNPLLTKNESWLTVGDGLGTDANWLIDHGISATATDISDSALKKAHQEGYINDYKKINAEQIDIIDDSYDYILCKEAYHHFPRPYIALYEMIRVAQKGVILIEPADIGVEMAPIIVLKGILDRWNTSWINKIWKNRYSFETVGNYVYKISEREIEKVAMGINLSHIAFKGINDYHSYKIDLSQPMSNKKILNHVKRKIAIKDLWSKMGLIPYSLKVAIIFKKTPTDKTLNELSNKGYKVIELAKNPYI